jgi:hypothetical protein
MPTAHSPQLPLPSQFPSVEQVETGLAVQSSLGSKPAATTEQAPAPLQTLQAPHCFLGSVPFGTWVQVPTFPTSAQDWQTPPQATSQQTPSTQKEDAHSAADPHGLPLPFLGTQTLLRQ